MLYDRKVDGKLLSFALPWSISSPVWLIPFDLFDIFDRLKRGFSAMDLGMPNGTSGGKKAIAHVMIFCYS